MIHFVIAKFKPEIPAEEKEAMYPEILDLFSHTKSIPGIRDVRMRTNCVNRPNRYDIMIMIDMEPDALPLYDECEWHKRWKSEYGALLETKAIFDSES